MIRFSLFCISLVHSDGYFSPFDSFRFILMIHFDDSFWSIWIISVTKFSLFYLISLILDDFGTFCLSILVHFSSF